MAEATQRMSGTQFSGCRMASQSSEISRLAFINLYKSSELTSEAWIAYAIPKHKYFNEIVRTGNTMRAEEFGVVIEAAMNPSEFGKAVATGQAKGVLVGFEFEVCVPKTAIDSATGDQESKKITTREIQQAIEQDGFFHLDLSDIAPKEFDQVFTIKPGKSSYANMTQALDALVAIRLDKIKELFYQIPEEKRPALIARAKIQQRERERYRDDATLPAQIKFGQALGRIVANTARNGSSLNKLGYEMYQQSEIDWETLAKFAFDKPGYQSDDFDIRFDQYFKYDPQQAYDILIPVGFVFGDEDDDDNYDREEYDYKGAVSVLKPAVQQTMGADVVVFNSYHEKRKNLTSWYIEPDGSLNPNDGDGAAEIVSPPMPAQQAMTALNSFYSMAQQLGLYTSADNGTGIHINVSIPDQLDLAKLAVFTGDQHVLKTFGREDNRYAQSALATLTSRAGKNDLLKVKSVSKKPGAIGQEKQISSIDFKMLEKIAKDATQSHFASISQGGKYISFRHAGGDYIGQQQEIVNTVGRFIRAMIIASDPNAYRQEYMAKLTKIIGAGAPVVDINKDTNAQLISAINYIRNNGLPALKMEMARRKPTTKSKNLTNWFMDNRDLTDTNVTIVFKENSEEARRVLLSKVQSDSLKKSFEDFDTNMFVTAIVTPKIGAINRMVKMPQTDTGVNGIKNNNYDTIGYGQLSKVTFPATSPEARQVLISLLQALKQSKGVK